MMQFEVSDFVALESRVWDALIAGDAKADAAMLADHFVGVYPSGIANKSDHYEQLENGATIDRYAILEPRIQVISPHLVMLIYYAEFRRPGSVLLEKMIVSSLWQQMEHGWKNIFSQDTPVTP